MSVTVRPGLEITPEQRELSLPMADMVARQAPDAESEKEAFIYLLGDGIHVTLSRPESDGTIPIMIGDGKYDGDGGWTPGFVKGADLRVKRTYWAEDESGILVPTGVLEPVVDAIETTEARCSRNGLTHAEINRKSLAIASPEGVDIDSIRQLRIGLCQAAFRGVDLV